MLGMYIHMHWGYGHPYCARTWSREDWRGYLEGLKALGYDFVMIWPMIETMPDPFTPSDQAFLGKIADVIQMARDRLGMHVAITICPNVIGNQHAAEYTFEERPYFRCEQRINPWDEGEVSKFMERRAKTFPYLAMANSLVIIDSDPGGYIGSFNEDFVNIVQRQVQKFRTYNPQAEFIYWMHMGWENYNRFWLQAQADPTRQPKLRFDLKVFIDTLGLMREKITEPWSVFAGIENHFDATKLFGMHAKRMLFPYGVIEGEPSFPLVNCDLGRMARMLKQLPRHPDHRGLMGNAQTHCLQLPHTFAFAEIARGVAPNKIDLLAFAQRLIPDCAPLIHTAWQQMETGPADQQAALAAELHQKARRENMKGGDCAGLLFGNPQRFLWDLAMNLEIRSRLSRFEQAIQEKKDIPQALKPLIDSLFVYEERVRFHDAYMGELEERLNNNLESIAHEKLQDILGKSRNWQSPEIRNGLALELFTAARDYCEEALTVA